jgi:hypothetical protein
MKSRTITILAALILGIYALSGCGVSQASEPDKVVVEDPTEPVTKTVSISGSGDVLAHSRQYNVAWNGKTYDFSNQFSKIGKLLTADVNICHLETPLSKGTPSGYPVFSSPISLAKALKDGGWDGCSVASNHSLDQGKSGVISTLKHMRAAGLVTAGAKTKATDSTVGWYTTDQGVTVAQLSYSWGFNGIPIPSDAPWLVNKISTKRIIAEAKAAKNNGAEVVIVSMHWGNEYWDNPSDLQKAQAKKLTASPYIDGIIGHHPHVIQPAKIVNGKPVIYSTGNIWSGQGPWADLPRGQHGVVVTLNFEITDGVVTYTGGTFVPTLTLEWTWVIKDARDVDRSDQVSEACRAIKDAADHLYPVLDGPTKCPK